MVGTGHRESGKVSDRDRQSGQLSRLSHHWQVSILANQGRELVGVQPVQAVQGVLHPWFVPKEVREEWE